MGFRRRAYPDICGRFFTISKYLGTFPFSVSSKGFRPSYYSLFVSVLVSVLLVYIGSLKWETHLRFIYLANQVVINKYFLIIPRVTLVVVSPVSCLWLLYKRKTLEKVIDALLVVERVTGHIPRPSPNPNYLLTLAWVVAYFSKLWFQRFDFSRIDIFFIFHVFISLAELVVVQFCSILRLIRSHYVHILESLDSCKAEKFTKCHEVLGSCCVALSKCYAPQLLIFLASIYMLLISQGFSTVLRVKVMDQRGAMYFLFWIVYEFTLVWYILYNCRESVITAEEFDRSLYKLTINDLTNVLLRNKRIQIHFKGKRKEEFSALGLFNFDYPLMCSMLSSATTYIAILVQFSQ